MKKNQLVAAIMLLTWGLSSTVSRAQEGLDALKLQRDIQLKILEEPLDALKMNYEAGLERLMEKTQASGDLQQALVIRKEIENYTKAYSIPSNDYPELAKLQEIYATESKKLIDESYLDRKIIIGKFEASLNELEVALTQAGNLDEALIVNNERQKNSKLLDKFAQKKALMEGVLLSEEFSAPLDPDIWLWSDTVQFADGFCFSITEGGNSRIELKQKISGDFRLEIDIVREGEHVYNWWDFSVRLTAASPVAAARLAFDDVNLLYINPSPRRRDDPGAPDRAGNIKVTQRGRKSDRGTISITYQNDHLIFGFVDSRGSEMKMDPIKVPEFDETGFVIRFGGTPDTPRKIERVSITRPPATED